MNVFDSSALLAYLQREPGATTVRSRLLEGGFCSAANWAEVAQKTLSSGRNWQKARMLLLSSGLTVEPITMMDAEAAARLWVERSSLSLADRICLALGARLDARIVTCDAAWEGRRGVELVR
jgi:ribonuclease VapC